MENEKLVSCVITTYNRPDLVCDAIDSVLKQTYRNIEIIVIDDNSTKPYAKAVEKYQSEPSVTFFRNERNLKLSASRNRGVKLSKGEYIAFLDDDDAWLPAKIKTQVEFLESHDEYLACTSSHIESESKKIVDNGIRKLSLQDILIDNLVGPPSKFIIRRDALPDKPFDENIHHSEDWDFYLKVLSKGKIYAIKEPLIIYNTGHFERMTNGFASLSIEQVIDKAHATKKNKEIIGEKNYKLRMANYFFIGFKKRDKKIEHFISVCKKLGVTSAISGMAWRTVRMLNRYNIHAP